MVQVRVQVDGVNIAREMEARAKQIEPALSSAVGAALPEMMTAAQLAARTLRIVSTTPSKKQQPTKPTNVRESMARAVSMRIDDNSVSVFINMTKMPQGKEHMPRLTNAKSWRHPVFGNTEVWTEQRAKPFGWFTKAVRTEALRHVPRELKKKMEGILS